MQLLIQIAQAGDPQATTGTDWKAFIGLPGGALALLGIAGYFVGRIRPFAVRKARYSSQGKTTRFSCSIANRSFMNSRTLTGVSIIRLPTLRTRITRPRWRSAEQAVDYVPHDMKVGSEALGQRSLDKRDGITVEGEIRKDGEAGAYKLDRRLRLQAHAAGKRSRSRRLKKRKQL